jgi:hypothetical protein
MSWGMKSNSKLAFFPLPIEFIFIHNNQDIICTNYNLTVYKCKYEFQNLYNKRCTKQTIKQI